MPRFLRFTPADYQTLAHTCHPLPRHVGYADFQRLVVKGLRTTHPALAARIASLRIREVRIVREHLENEQSILREHLCRQADAEGKRECNLSLQDWRIISEVYSLNCLHEEADSGEEALLLQVREVSPTLAKKLSRLSEGQVAQLYQRVRSGKRWCW